MLAVIGATLLLAACSSSATSPTPAAGSVEATASTLVGGIMRRQPEGKLVAAAYAVSTFEQYQAAQPPEQRYVPENVAPSDRVLVVKVFGRFPSAHSGPKGANTDATVIFVCYDLKLGVEIETGYTTGPEPPDIPGAPAGTIPSFPDLRRLGTPELIKT